MKYLSCVNTTYWKVANKGLRDCLRKVSEWKAAKRAEGSTKSGKEEILEGTEVSINCSVKLS